jgi:hypothetical protein
VIARPTSLGDAWRVMIQQKDKIAELEKEAQILKSANSCYIILNLLMINIIDSKVDESDEIRQSDWDFITKKQYKDFKTTLEIRDLEQQAKILKELAKEVYTDTKEGCAYHAILIQKALELTRKARALKEQG